MRVAWGEENLNSKQRTAILRKLALSIMNALDCLLRKTGHLLGHINPLENDEACYVGTKLCCWHH